MTARHDARARAGRRRVVIVAVLAAWAWATAASAAPFENAAALKAAVNNCLAASHTGDCDCSSASVDCGAAGSDAMSQWDTSLAPDMSYLLHDARSFNQSIRHWNTSQVTNLVGMFM